MKLTPAALRVSRLLQLIPFLQANSGVSVDTTAKFFGITEEQLISDLNLIWLCGLPGYSHLELIDVSYDSGVISINNAETVDRPMRLSFDEGAALLLAIESLITIAPVGDSKILLTLRSKLLRALDLDQEAPQESAHTLNNEKISGSSPVLPVILKALESPNQVLDFLYYSATLDTSIHAQIIPERIFVQNGFTYLAAFSLTTGEHAMYRVDRIESATPAQQPSDISKIFDKFKKAEKPEASEGSAIEATVEIRREGAWFIQKWGLANIEYDQQIERFRGVIKVYNPSWLIRAALSLGGALAVIAPAELRSEVAKAAESALERYR
ncbi:MAG: helix-turn-helix transcriptional regulator [Candidatus Nanopelagicaceae bacterium]